MLTPDRFQKLETAIDGVTESYAGPEEINNLDSATLPNKRAVIAAYAHLKAALYLGYYSQRVLNQTSLRFALSEHLYPAYESLVEQARRAFAYPDFCQTRVSAPPDCEELILNVIRAIPELRRVLNEDVRAAYEGDPAAESREEIIFSYPGLEAITAHRIASLLHAHNVPILPRIVAAHAHSLTGIDIHPGAKIGEGFFIDHGSGVVIGATAVIGRHVKVYQGVTLGALSTKRSECGKAGLVQKRHPTIEDNVTIYAGATILGGDTVIGHNSVIGGNVWLTHSVPPLSKIFGRPRE